MGHASEKRCDPDKKAAFAAAQAAAGGDDNGDSNDFGNGGAAAGGDDGWNQTGGDVGGSGQASWETDVAPSAPATTAGGW